jgi:hypothetical protein
MTKSLAQVKRNQLKVRRKSRRIDRINEGVNETQGITFTLFSAQPDIKLSGYLLSS